MRNLLKATELISVRGSRRAQMQPFLQDYAISGLESTPQPSSGSDISEFGLQQPELSQEQKVVPLHCSPLSAGVAIISHRATRGARRGGQLIYEAHAAICPPTLGADGPDQRGERPLVSGVG